MDELVSVHIGETKDMWEPVSFDAALRDHRGTSPHPLTFAECSRLARSGGLLERPREDDPAIYAGDNILAMSDADIVCGSFIAAQDFRRLRRAWLYKRALTHYHIRHSHETAILDHIRPQLVGGSLTYRDYIGYLEKFHLKDCEAFFSIRPLPVMIKDLKKHAYIAAGSGHGKTELMKSVIHAVMKAGYGVILLDPHGDVAEQVAAWPEFAKDPERLFYFDAHLDGLKRYPVINPLDPIHTAPGLLLDSTIETFLDTIPAVIGADGELSSRMRTLLKPCLYTLAHFPESTLYDLLAFVTEEEHEENGKKTGKYKPGGWIERARKTLTNRAQLGTLDSFFETSYKTTKGAIADRLRALLSSDTLDKCLAGINSVDLPSLMDSGKVCVFSLSAGLLGADTSSAFGRFLLCAIQGAAMRRQEQEAHERKPVFLFMDEADRFMSQAVVDIYKETRKYGLHLCLSQQITGYNMPDDMYRAIVGNSRVRFAGSSGDDQTIRDLSRMTGVDAEEVKRLAPLHFHMRAGERESIQFRLNKNLLGNTHKMTVSEWETVKAYQLATYYKKPLERPENDHSGHVQKAPEFTHLDFDL